MVEKIKAYFETLEGLSTKALTDSAEKLVRDEKQKVALLIAHIAEMSRRKAELACGYKNLFTYCVEKLHLSEGSVAMRIQVANVAKYFPQLLVALADNRISLTVAAHLARHLHEENVDKLLSECAGMTKRAVAEYLVALRPKPVFNPSIRKRPSTKRSNDKSGNEGQQEATQEREPPKQPASSPSAEEKPSKPPPSPSPTVLEPARTDTYNFRFSADENFKEKFERLAEVLGVENPLKNMAEVFERAMDISLEKKDPKKKLERRLEKERKRGAETKKARPDEVAAEDGAPSGSDKETTSRYIPSKVRERVPRAPDTSANTGRKTERGADRKRDSRSTTNGPLRSIVVTTSAIFVCSVVDTIASRRSDFMGPDSSEPRLKKKSARRSPESVSGNPLHQLHPISPDAAEPQPKGMCGLPRAISCQLSAVSSRKKIVRFLLTNSFIRD